jgi:hypothetical protein
MLFPFVEHDVNIRGVADAYLHLDKPTSALQANGSQGTARHFQTQALRSKVGDGFFQDLAGLHLGLNAIAGRHHSALKPDAGQAFPAVDELLIVPFFLANEKAECADSSGVTRRARMLLIE